MAKGYIREIDFFGIGNANSEWVSVLGSAPSIAEAGSDIEARLTAIREGSVGAEGRTMFIFDQEDPDPLHAHAAIGSRKYVGVMKKAQDQDTFGKVCVSTTSRHPRHERNRMGGSFCFSDLANLTRHGFSDLYTTSVQKNDEGYYHLGRNGASDEEVANFVADIEKAKEEITTECLYLAEAVQQHFRKTDLMEGKHVNSKGIWHPSERQVDEAFNIQEICIQSFIEYYAKEHGLVFEFVASTDEAERTRKAYQEMMDKDGRDEYYGFILESNLGRKLPTYELEGYEWLNDRKTGSKQMVSKLLRAIEHKDKEPGVIMGRDEVPPEVLSSMAVEPDVRRRVIACIHQNTEAAALMYIIDSRFNYLDFEGQSEDEVDRNYLSLVNQIASSSNFEKLPIDYKEKLLNLGEIGVRESILENPSMTAETIEYLVREISETGSPADVRALLGNPSLTEADRQSLLSAIANRNR